MLIYTQSTVAKNILDHWSKYQSKFVKVMPEGFTNVCLRRSRRQKQKAHRSMKP